MVDEEAAGSLRFEYSHAYALSGITLPTPEIGLGAVGDGVEGFLVRDLGTRCLDAERALAIGELLMSGLFAPDRLAAASERITQVIERNVSARRERFAGCPYLLLVARGECAKVKMNDLQCIDGMWIGFDAVSKDRLRAPYESVQAATLVAVALSQTSLVGTHSVLDQVVVYRGDSQPIFSYTVKAGAVRMRVNRAVSESEVASEVRRAAVGLGKRELKRIGDLLLRSLSTERDRLRSFLAAWTGLEILVNKLFGHYEALLFDELARERPEPLPKYLKQMQTVMSARYRLKDKFMVVSASLDPGGAGDDLAEFETIKKLRDDLTHGDEIGEDALPVEQTAKLLRKYLALHVHALAP